MSDAENGVGSPHRARLTAIGSLVTVGWWPSTRAAALG